MGSILVPFWCNFGDKNLYKILLNFERASGNDFGCPRAASKAKNHDFHWSVVQKRRSTFSPPGAPEVDFGGQNGAKMGAEIDEKCIKTVLGKSIGKSTEK